MLRLPLLIVALACSAKPLATPPDPWVRHEIREVVEIKWLHHRNTPCETCRRGGPR